MLFEHLKLEKEDFKDFLRHKKFDVSEVPIIDDYFSLAEKPEQGYIISVNGTLDKVIGFIFCSLKKSQSFTLVQQIEYIFSLSAKSIPYSNKNNKVTLTFVFKDNKISIIIKNLLHLVIAATEIVRMSISDVELSFKHNVKFDRLLKMLGEKNKEYFETIYQIPYTVENIEKTMRKMNTRYNLNAVHYSDFINKEYDQHQVAQHMNEHYVGMMLSSVINFSQSLSLLVHEPTVDMSRKVNNDGKFFGHERVTFPVKDVKKSEPLLNHLLVNEWSRHTIQMVNAMILYQLAINGNTVKHFSVVMPKLYENQRQLSNFELFTVVSESDTYDNNIQSFKIIFGLTINIQVKDKTTIVYNEKFKSIDDAYVHFIEYFRKRIIKKIPDNNINDNTLKLLSMINF